MTGGRLGSHIERSIRRADTRSNGQDVREHQVPAVSLACVGKRRAISGKQDYGTFPWALRPQLHNRKTLAIPQEFVVRKHSD